jgi:6-pyruvoyltetrahydropterin/6-carboxytetrahydropterin synthase
MFSIGKAFTFEAAHRLGGLPDGHKCSRPHGHSYTVEVILESPVLSAPGFVADFAELEPVRAYLDRSWDHRDLNEVLAAEPTSENIARHLREWCRANLGGAAGPLVAAVRVSETRSTWAEYRPERIPAAGAA